MNKNYSLYTEKEKAMIGIANHIASMQQSGYISGSIGLIMQGIKTRREPTDIDIYIAYGTEPKIPDGATRVEYQSDSNSSNDEQYNRVSFLYEGYKIEIYKPATDDNFGKMEVIHLEQGDCVYFSDIIRLKIEHAFDDSVSRFKHKDDIIFMMSNIQ